MEKIKKFYGRTRLYNLGRFLYKISLGFVFFIGATTDYSGYKNVDVLVIIACYCTLLPYIYAHLKPKIKCNHCHANLSGTYSQSYLHVAVCPYCSQKPRGKA